MTRPVFVSTRARGMPLALARHFGTEVLFPEDVVANKEFPPTDPRLLYFTYGHLKPSHYAFDPDFAARYTRASEFFALSKLEQLLVARHFMPTILGHRSNRLVHRVTVNERNHTRRSMAIVPFDHRIPPSVLLRGQGFLVRAAEYRVVFFNQVPVAAYTRYSPKQDEPWNNKGIEPVTLDEVRAVAGKAFWDGMMDFVSYTQYTFAGIDIAIDSNNGWALFMEINATPGITGPIKDIVLPKVIEAVERYVNLL